jgi:hypothetical protein
LARRCRVQLVGWKNKNECISVALGPIQPQNSRIESWKRPGCAQGPNRTQFPLFQKVVVKRLDTGTVFGPNRGKFFEIFSIRNLKRRRLQQFKRRTVLKIQQKSKKSPKKRGTFFWLMVAVRFARRARSDTRVREVQWVLSRHSHQVTPVSSPAEG